MTALNKNTIDPTLSILAVLFWGVFAGSGCSSTSSPAPAPEPEMTSRTAAPSPKVKPAPPVRATPSSSKPVTVEKPAAPSSPPASGAQKAPVYESPTPKTQARPARPTTSVPEATRTAKVDNSLDALLGTTPSMSAQESGSGSSIRGLSPISQSYAQTHQISEQAVQSLHSMETFKVSPMELKNFLKEGRLRQ